MTGVWGIWGCCEAVAVRSHVKGRRETMCILRFVCQFKMSSLG